MMTGTVSGASLAVHWKDKSVISSGKIEPGYKAINTAVFRSMVGIANIHAAQGLCRLKVVYPCALQRWRFSVLPNTSK